MKIDLIIAIKEAYQKIYADKLKAKKLIKELKDLKYHFHCDSRLSEKIEEYLGVIWHDLPIKQRKDYIQKTLDLFHYGFDVEYHEDGSRTYYGGYDFGLTKIYKLIENCIDDAIKTCEAYYSNHEYQRVELAFNESIMNVDKKLVQYGILDERKDDEGKTETV